MRPAELAELLASESRQQEERAELLLRWRVRSYWQEALPPRPALALARSLEPEALASARLRLLGGSPTLT